MLLVVLCTEDKKVCIGDIFGGGFAGFLFFA